MHLSVYSLKKVLFEGEAESVNMKTASGEITVLDHHRPLISALAPGTIKIVDKTSKEHYIPVSSGFAEVNSANQARLMVDEP
ncbi:MAG: F0F1 ATP synthase subunit epsilon [Patescibacteria group bacterium]